jgi:Transcription mediator complex subunit Med12
VCAEASQQEVSAWLLDLCSSCPLEHIAPRVPSSLLQPDVVFLTAVLHRVPLPRALWFVQAAYSLAPPRPDPLGSNGHQAASGMQVRAAGSGLKTLGAAAAAKAPQGAPRQGGVGGAAPAPVSAVRERGGGMASSSATAANSSSAAAATALSGDSCSSVSVQALCQIDWTRCVLRQLGQLDAALTATHKAAACAGAALASSAVRAAAATAQATRAIAALEEAHLGGSAEQMLARLVCTDDSRVEPQPPPPPPLPTAAVAPASSMPDVAVAVDASEAASTAATVAAAAAAEDERAAAASASAAADAEHKAATLAWQGGLGLAAYCFAAGLVDPAVLLPWLDGQLCSGGRGSGGSTAAATWGGTLEEGTCSSLPDAGLLLVGAALQVRVRQRRCILSAHICSWLHQLAVPCR